MTNKRINIGFSNEEIADLEAVKLAIGARTRPEAIRALLREYKEKKELVICPNCSKIIEEAKE